MLRYKPASAFSGGRYPPPLEALGIPSDALSDERVDGLSLRLRNSAVAFVLLHELGHILYGHGGYKGISKEQARANEQQADRFALEVMERTKTIPMGAVMFFQTQAYSLPHRGQFSSDAEWERYLESEETHPMTTDRLHAMARYMNSAARRESRPAEADSLVYIATRLTEIASILEDPLLERCIAVVARNADPTTLKPRREVAGSQMQKWCGKDK
jgi:predicted Zn-dependent protease